MRRLMFILAMMLSMGVLPAIAAEKPDILEVMTIDGVIHDGTAKSIAEQVEKINDNKRIKAVLLVVDSPGGGVLPSAVIYEELSKLRVPVVGYCQNICASGGMYVLMAPSVKYIGVRTSTISGSIGVVMSIQRFYRLLDWAKIDSETFVSGRSKDSGNPTRAPIEGERAELQATIDELAGTFYGIVGKARPKLTPAQWVEIKAAKIFFGAKGVEVGLVDAVMSREAVEKRAKELSGSKFILTKEEIKRLGRDTGEPTSPFGNTTDSMPSKLLTDLQWAFDVLREIKSGQSIRIDYLSPIRL